VPHDARVAVVEGPGAMKEAAVVPDHDVAGLPRVKEGARRLACSFERHAFGIERTAAAIDSSVVPASEQSRVIVM